MRSAPSELASGHPVRAGAVTCGAAVEVDGLTWRPYGRRTPVLDDLTLRIGPGERVLLAGPSGCGKSTLLRALAGLLEVADAGELSGTVAVDGVAPVSTPGLIAMVLQDPGAGVVAGSLDRDVAFGPENAGMPRATIAAAVPGALAQVRLGMDPAGPTAALSGGEQQRLAVAGALALRPRVLLLDEPTSMLDPGSAASVRAAVREVVERTGLTTVVVEHRLDAWLDLADRLVVLGADGRVVADAPPLEVLNAQAHDLLAQGVWVPRAPAPRPAPIPATLFGDAAPRVRPGRAVLRADGVSVTRARRSLNRPARVTTALCDVSLAATAGRTLAVAGPSGSGKSTLLTVLAGLVRPTGGSVVADPAVVPPGSTPDPSRWRSADIARTVAWVPQSAGSTLVARTVLDELLATSRALGVPDATSRPRADVLLGALSLDHLTGADPRWLSGGEQRRLAVAAAVLHRPAVLLTDEPTIGQDRLTWAAVTGVAEALRRSGSAVVHATHDADLLALADDVLRLPGAPVTHQPVGERSTRSAGSTRLTGSTRTPLAARCGPLSLLAAAALALPAALTVGTWRVGAALLALAVVLSVVALATPGGGRNAAGERPSRGPGLRTLRFREPGSRGLGSQGAGSRASGLARRLVPGLLAATSVGWSAWLLGGHSVPTAAGAFFRVAVLVYPSAVVLPFVDPDRLAEHLVQRGRLPARPVVAACAALQRAQSVGDLWDELARARRVRGLGPGRSPVSRARQAASLTFAALVDSLGAAGRLAVAMDARGFAAAGRRTWLHPARWARADTVAVLLAAALPVTGLVLGRLHG